MKGVGPESGGGLAGGGFEFPAEMLGGFETAAQGDVLNGQVGKLQVLFRHADPVIPQIIHGSGMQFPVEQFRQGGVVQGSGGGDVREPEGFMVMAFHEDHRLFQVAVGDGFGMGLLGHAHQIHSQNYNRAGGSL